MKKLTNLMAVIAIIVSSSILTSCKKEEVNDRTPITEASNVMKDKSFDQLKAKVYSGNLTKADTAYLVSKLLDPKNAGITGKGTIYAPKWWGHGGEFVQWNATNYVLNVHSIYTYWQNPQTQLSAIGVFQTNYKQSGVLKHAIVIKMIQPGVEEYDFKTLDKNGLAIDYGTTFTMESGGLSATGNISYFTEPPFGPYYAPGNRSINEMPTTFGTTIIDKHIQKN